MNMNKEWAITLTGESEVTATRDDGLNVTMRWENHNGEDILTSVNFHRINSPILAQDTRISLSELVEQALHELNSKVDPDDTEARREQARKEWPKGDLEKVFIPICKAYNHAIRNRQPATEAVAEYMDVSRATAGRIISKAREAGYPLANPIPYPGKR